MLNDAIRRLVLRLRESPLYALFGNDKPAVVRQNLDTFLVATALKCYDWQVAHREDLNARVDAKLTKEFVKELEEEHVDGRKKYVQNMINRQMIAWFNRFEESNLATTSRSSSRSSSNSSSSSNGNKAGEIGRDNFALGDDDEGPVFLESLYDSRTKEEVQQATSMSFLDFSLEVKKSSIEGAGQGVYVMNTGPRNFISPGTLLAIFPGLVHLSEYTKSNDYVASLFPDPDFQLTMRPDGHIIDSRDRSDFRMTHTNPLALAHYVNHVPADGESNVMQIPYDFMADPWGTHGKDGFPAKLKRHIPLKYAKPPTLLGTIDQSAHMHAMVLISTKPIRDGEELFMDYRLEGDPNELPVWFVPYKRAMDKEEVDDEVDYDDNDNAKKD